MADCEQQLPNGSWGRSGAYTVLVNRDSATSNYYRKDKSVTIPIQSDHSNMVKFGRGDVNLAIVTSLIAEIFTAADLTVVPERGGPSTDLPGSTVSGGLGRQPSKGGESSDYPSLTELDYILSALKGLSISLR
jgi:hypothetical protein